MHALMNIAFCGIYPSLHWFPVYNLTLNSNILIPNLRVTGCNRRRLHCLHLIEKGGRLISSPEPKALAEFIG